MTTGALPAIIDHLLRCSAAPPEEISTYGGWKRSWRARSSHWRRPIEGALAMGLAADCPAWAFAAGYQAAIQALTAPLALEGLGAVCVTERGGTHPARLQSILVALPEAAGQWRLDGEKTFVTGAAEADCLLVAAVAGTGPRGRRRIRMAAVDAGTPGLIIEERPALALVPELPHAGVRFEGVLLSDDQLLPGDGYIDGMKRFRVLEDLYGPASMLAWVFGVGRRAGGPQRRLAALLQQMAAACALARSALTSPAAHIVLGGWLEAAQGLLAGDEGWDRVPGREGERWDRDRALLNMAATARKQRFTRAWGAYNGRA